MAVYEVKHPLIQHKLSILRNKDTYTKLFRENLNEIAGLMTYEVTRSMKVVKKEVETPLMKTEAFQLPENSLTLVPILRAGLGMIDGILKLVPIAKVGHIGVYRNEETLEPVYYYCKLPTSIKESKTILVDPMLATGGSAIYCIDYLKKEGVKDIVFVCLVAAPEGIKNLTEKHPDVDIYTACVDEKLNDVGYILPGLGDAGDRIFGTH